METDSQPASRITIPLAIVIAGALIAVAVYMSGGKNTDSDGKNTQAEIQTAQTIGAGKISVRPVSASDHFLGDPNSPVGAIVYTDLECPYCKSFHSTMQTLLLNYGKTGKMVWVYRHFPIQQLHTKAPNEAVATECASNLGGQTAFWKYTDEIFIRTPSNDGLEESELPKIAADIGLDKTKFTECLESGVYESDVKTDFDEAIAAGGRGTPFTVFVLKNPLSAEQLKSIEKLTQTYSPDILAVAEDNRHVLMSGALPLLTIENLLNIMLGIAETS